MISTLRLRNYRNHKDTTIRFEHLTALVGPNSAGKSNVLEAIRCFTKIPEERNLKGVFREEQALEVVVRRGQSFFELQLVGEEPTSWSVDIRGTVEGRPDGEDARSNEPGIQLSGEWGWGEQKGELSAKTMFPNQKKDQKIASYLSRAVHLKVIAENLSAPSAPQDVPPVIHPNGKGLASVISYLMTTEPDRFECLVQRLQSIVPEVEGLRTRPIPAGKRTKKEKGRLDELLYDMRGGKGIPAHSVSEGTLIATGLLAAIIGNEEREPHLLMIDDLEQGLHPKAQRELIDVLRAIQQQQSPLQIVFTTHSPYIVDELMPEETWLLNTDEEGVAHTRRLSDHPDAEHSLQVLTTGEFWSAEGEDWIVGNGASDEVSQPSDTE